MKDATTAEIFMMVILTLPLNKELTKCQNPK